MERVRALWRATVLTDEELKRVHPDGTPLGCAYAEGDTCTSCGRAGEIGVGELDDHADDCPAREIELRHRAALRQMHQAAPEVFQGYLDLAARLESAEAELARLRGGASKRPVAAEGCE